MGAATLLQKYKIKRNLSNARSNEHKIKKATIW